MNHPFGTGNGNRSVTVRTRTRGVRSSSSARFRGIGKPTGISGGSSSATEDGSISGDDISMPGTVMSVFRSVEDALRDRVRVGPVDLVGRRTDAVDGGRERRDVETVDV